MNKRDFLKLACAAPIVGPVIARHMTNQKYVYAEGRLVDWADYGGVSGMIPVSPNEHLNINPPSDWLAAPEPNPALRRLLHSTSPWDVPNRLHGAFIKEDGDAA
jgi:hypothetical protein